MTQVDQPPRIGTSMLVGDVIGARTPSADMLTPSASALPSPRETPELYLNRELTWLNFDGRVLNEAEDERNPLLERVKFLAISASNLDEFFMKRIGGLKQQIAAGIQEPTVDGRTPQQQIDACYVVIRALQERQRSVYRELLGLLDASSVFIRSCEDLTPEQQRELRAQYVKNIFPLVTPQVLDPAHPFPLISNLSLNLLTTGRDPNGGDGLMARIKVPVGFAIKRFLRLSDGRTFVRLEEVIARNIDLLFPGIKVESSELFRVTRNANTERDEDEADDLLELIETELRDRRMAPIVRLEVQHSMDATHRGMLAAELGLNEDADVFEADGTFGLRDLMEIATAIDAPALHDPPFHPVDNPLLPEERNIFHSIRDARSVFLLHPYQSFATSVERFLADASQDPKVRAVKMTLYRTSSDARIIGHLIEAARNGKQVAVVVELKARFDEAANIAFASRLEDFGIHVSYGVLGYKTHCKVILVVRQDYDGLRRYAHIGTGNYHPDTARLYADFGLFTTDSDVCQDLTELFNFLTTGYDGHRTYRKILPAPRVLKAALLEKIEREAHLGADGLIRFKMNALEDPDVTRALYAASRAGVQVELLVRDTCRLRPGLPNLSETIRVVSIVGRFLEHGRIYYFRNGGAEELFIGSADCMKRNLESRIEVLVPVDLPLARRMLQAVFDLQLAPNRNAWTMQSDGSYVHAEDPDLPSSQQALAVLVATTREETRPGKRRPVRFARRPVQGSPV